MSNFNIPEGFNQWSQEVQLLYIEVRRIDAEKELKRIDAEKEVRMIDAQKELRMIDAQKEVRIMELKVQSETLTMKRLSIGKGDAVFILYIIHEGTLEVSGTAFAISETLIITAYHNFSIEGGGHHPNCAITRKANNVDGMLTPMGDCISLELLSFNEVDDWALFCRRDTGVFSTFLPICQQGELPAPSSDVTIHQYYYSLGLILNSTIKNLCVWSDSTSLLQYDYDGKYAILKRGKTNGSSGSPAVTCDGKVLGVHVDSFTESPAYISSYTADSPHSPPQAKVGVIKRRLSEEGASERNGYLRESDSVLSGPSDLSHASYSRVLVLSATPLLMEAVQKANAEHSASGGSI